MPKSTVKIFQPVCPDCGTHMVKQPRKQFLVMEQGPTTKKEDLMCQDTIRRWYRCPACPMAMYLSD